MIMIKYVIEFKKETGPACYYQGTFSGMGKLHNFTESIDLAQTYPNPEAAEQVIATLPMAAILQAVEHQFGD